MMIASCVSKLFSLLGLDILHGLATARSPFGVEWAVEVSMKPFLRFALRDSSVLVLNCLVMLACAPLTGVPGRGDPAEIVFLSGGVYTVDSERRRKPV